MKAEPPASGPFVAEKRIRFHHCDPAGIVFFPQYFVLFNEVIEDWFTDGLDTSFVDQITQERVSTPLVKLTCEFVAPSRIGDVIRIALRVRRVGRSSITLLIDGSCDSETRVRAELVVVNSSLETLRPVPISDTLRDRMLQYQD